MNFIPRVTVSVDIEGKYYYASLIYDNDFQLKLVLLDANDTIVDTLLELDRDTANIVKLRNKLYTITSEYAYIYDIKDLKEGHLQLCQIVKKNIY